MQLHRLWSCLSPHCSNRLITLQLFTLLCLCIALLPSPVLASSSFDQLSTQQRLYISDLIYANECNRKPDCLVTWNAGENFASLGIGHFIWFPKDVHPPFKESFPALLRWFTKQGVLLPAWLTPDSPCPWYRQSDLNKPENQQHIQDLKTLLSQTHVEQTSFIMSRLQAALPKILHASQDLAEQQHIQQQFERVSASPAGWYVLADYVNFKGEGIQLKERYHGQGWGLRQVLLHMFGKHTGEVAIEAFVRAARFVLQRRVALSPPQRHEQRWLKGWFKRLNTYSTQAQRVASTMAEVN